MSSPVVATSKVTAREKTSEAVVATEFGSLSTVKLSNSGAVYSRVTAESVFGLMVEDDKSCEDEKSANKGVKAKSANDF